MTSLEEDETWLPVWRRLVDGEETFIDGSFAAGACSRKNQSRPGYEADGGGRRSGYSSRRLPLFGLTGGSDLGRGHIGLTRANGVDTAFDC